MAATATRTTTHALKYYSHPSMAVPILLFSTLLAVTFQTIGARIGVVYGLQGKNLPPPREVVDLYKRNNIRSMRILAPVPEVLQALEGSGIELMMGVADEDIHSLATNMDNAYAWVRSNIINYPNVSFRYIAVGDEVKIGPPAPPEENYLLRAMKNIHRAVSEAGLGSRIKVSTPFSESVVVESSRSFRPDYGWCIDPIIRFLAETDSPFLMNIQPYYSYTNNSSTRNITAPGHALFSPPAVEDEPGAAFVYGKFDGIMGAGYLALAREGKPNMSFIVTATGWPSAGEPASTLEWPGFTIHNWLRG